MIPNDKLKELCKQILEELPKDAVFNFVFDNRLVIGYVLDITGFGLSMGEKNNIIGHTIDCAEIFYAILVTYVVQIKEIMNYSSAEVVHMICDRLKEDLIHIDDMQRPINFRNVDLHKPGNA